MLKRVIIVDDDEDVRLSTSILLRLDGYDPQTFVSGQELLDGIATLKPGCILLDYRMQGLTGLQVLRALRALGISWPVVLMTGHADTDVGLEALKMGALAFLEKPFPENALLEVLDRAYQTFRITDEQGLIEP